MKRLTSILIVGACVFSVYLVTRMRLTPPAVDELGERQQVKATITHNSNLTATTVTQDQHLASMPLRGEVTDLRKHEMEPRIQSQPQSDTNSLAGIIQILEEQSNNPDADSKRFAAAQRLRNLGISANEGFPVFRDLLHNADSTLAFSGARALAFISESSPEAFDELSSALAAPLLGFLWSPSQLNVWSKWVLSAFVICASAVLASLIGEYISKRVNLKNDE